MERVRALEIIEAYGGDPARWPETEREGVKALLSSDLTVRRAAEEGVALDSALGRWATGGPPDDAGAALAAADAALAAAGRSQRRRWLPAGLFGGAAAAAAVAVALVMTPPQTRQPIPASQVAVQQTAAADDVVDTHLWSMTFTPTPEEESLI